MVDAHFNSFFITTQNAARVSSICNIDFFVFFVDENHVGCTADSVQHHLLGSLFALILVASTAENTHDGWLLGRLCSPELNQLVVSSWCSKLVVHFKEGKSQPLLDLLVFVSFDSFPVNIIEDLFVMLATVDGDLPASMTVEDPKERIVFVVEIWIGDVGILLIEQLRSAP